MKSGQIRISDCFKPKTQNPLPMKQQHQGESLPRPSRSLLTAASLADLDYMEVDPFGFEADLKVLEASFQTPVQSESETEDSPAYQRFVKKADAIPISGPLHGTKRPLPLSQSEDSRAPRKNPREMEYVAVNHFESKPSHNTSFHAELWEAQSRATSAATSANTSFTVPNNESFRTDITSTSFMGAPNQANLNGGVIETTEPIDDAGPVNGDGCNMNVDGPTEATGDRQHVPRLIAGQPVHDYLERALIAEGPLRKLDQSERSSILTVPR